MADSHLDRLDLAGPCIDGGETLITWPCHLVLRFPAPAPRTAMELTQVSDARPADRLLIRARTGIASSRIDASPSENSGTEVMEVGFVVLVTVLELVVEVFDVIVWVGGVLEEVV